MPDGHSYCTQCERCLPLDRFPPAPRKSNGVDSWCRSCRAASRAARRAESPGAWRDHYLRATFGLSEQAFVDMLAAQGNACAICSTSMPWGESAQLKNFSVDHDHSCCPGKKSCGRCVRGLLCNPCNRALGQFRDDVDILRRAVAYLERTWPPP